MEFKTFFVKVTCLMFLSREILCLLNRKDPNVCEIYASGGDDISEAYTVECCLNYYEEDDICKPCRPGKFGRQCSETCIYGYFGIQCKGLCNCTQYEGCDPIEGCKCIDFTGKNCKYKCPEGYYGKNCVNVCHCLRGISCDSVTGSCLCPAGLTGPTCSTKCSGGLYGENCSFNCSCPTYSVCDSVSGNCSCSPGFTGETCAKRCPSDFFGQNCSQRCQCVNGLSCHPVHGTCRCQNGTHDCDEQNNSSRSSITIVIAVACSGGSLIIVCSIILTVCFFKRKHGQESVNSQAMRPLPGIYHYDEINPYDEIPLEDLPVASDISDIAPLQVRRLSLPHTNGQMNNRTRNEESRGYISLPNLRNDRTYFSPYNSLQSVIIHLRNNSTEQSLRRVDSEHSGYVHPYHALRLPFDHQKYTSFKKRDSV
ncbi:Multiple epidermal growth factor-like domains protein 11,Multiple epidermal growth factor-like domains protein 10,Multiple epidermal growth factor-like domains protein 6 [Mytilus coruscus]|uniref:Multiple epidermal growth factor-like domains protein 11,Multiple epidermal growth factor-like domains protein 10,Multiple epidermal growth factor-like domains protein 6 n=1 Tax=Mytilus coruscus TaxID=42192 RepID=A0A6J8AN83_MYTCO|nr:Multiple epidermal growth factor-like domains protein 11,Multiple epidermal growth factor-like domains protein 10,Multiple epidermal growth factor-like domains protein 6 [Mytilus coruscus]